MSVNLYARSNTRIRVTTGPGPSIQCQITLLNGHYVLIVMGLPEKTGANSVPIRVTARHATSDVFEEVSRSGPAWLPLEQRSILLRLVKEVAEKITGTWADPSKSAVYAIDLFVEVLEKVRAYATS